MTITIEVNNSYSQVKGMTTAIYQDLKKLLSYEINPEAAHFSGGFVRRKSLIDKTGSFPSGLLTRITKRLYETGHVAKIQDIRVRPVMGRYPNKQTISPYKWQVEAVKAAAKAGQGTISACTGSGKSLVIALIAASFGLKTLVVTPSVEIRNQLREGLKALKNVSIENVDSLRLQTLTDFDVLLIDECHRAAAAKYQKLNKTKWNKIYYRFMLSATPWRNNANEQLLYESICGKLIYELTYKQAVTQGFIVPVEGYVINLQKRPVEGYTWAQVYSELVVNNEHRNLVIADTLLKLNAAGVSTLCLVKEVAHGDNLSALTGLPFANGKDEDTRQFIEQFNTGKIKTLIGTTGILAEGVNTKPCEYVIIAGLGKAKSAFMQSIGRCVRTYPGKESGKVIIFKDSSHKFTLRHYNAQKSILLGEYGISVIVL